MNEDYRVELPRDVIALTKTKVKPHQRRWILLAARDDDFDAVSVEIDLAGQVETIDSVAGVVYEKLFTTLEWLAAGRGQVWCLTFRSRHVLAKAKWLKALTDGRIELERQRKIAGKQAGRGAICLSHGMTDLDLRIGKRKVKLLDWSNYGVSFADYFSNTENKNADDVLGVFADWLGALDHVGLSASRTSAPQIGWTKLRQSLKHTQIFTSLDPAIRALERRCYYGGRCEPFRLGEVKQAVHLVDIRGCYASICAEYELPIMPLRYYPDGCSHATIGEQPFYDWAADVIVSTQTPRYPVRHLGKVIYPIGVFATSLCCAELADAIKAGRIVKVLRAVSYATEPALGGYADWYMGARDAIKTGFGGRHAASLKAAFNSSLGFLARQGREWQLWEPAGSPPWWIGITNDPDDASKIVSAHVLDSQAELLRIGSEPRNCAPIVHAAICAAARVKLADLMFAAGQHSVMYCDTDGMIVDNYGWGRLNTIKQFCGPDYGQLAIRHSADRCTINGQKNYRIGDKVVCAGLPASKHKEWQAREALATDTGTVDRYGVVSPYKLRIEEMGDADQPYQNVLQ